ncbi:MAG: hypothetical protein ACXVJ1_05625 [Candidatus Angelobacter sp.]
MKPKAADISNSRGVLLARGLSDGVLVMPRLLPSKQESININTPPQSVEVEETRLWELDYKPEDIG